MHEVGGRGAIPQTRRLASPPTEKLTSQKSGAGMWEIFKFLIILQSKSVNNICKPIQLLGDKVSRPLPGLRPWTPPGDFRPSDPLGYRPPMKIPGTSTVRHTAEEL